MLEQAYTPPETKYEVHIDELMKAIRGEDFVQGNGLWRMRGGEIPESYLFGQTHFFLSAQQEYVILTETKLTGKGNIEIDNINVNQTTLAFIIYKSIIPPSINLRNTTGHWEFHNSETGNIKIEKNCVVGRIDIGNECKVEYISITGESEVDDVTIKNSQIKSITLTNKSKLGNIMITQNSQSDSIMIYGNSIAGRIWITENSCSKDIIIDESNIFGRILITDDSQIDDILIGYNSNIQEVGVAKNSSLKLIKISGNSKTGNIAIIKNSQSDGITIQDSSVTGDISISKNQKALPISISGPSQTGNLTFTDALLSQIDIRGNYFGLRLYNTQFQVMKITDSLITELDFQTGVKGELYVSQSRILHLRVANAILLKESILSLSDTQLQYGILEEVLAQGNLLLRKLRPPTPAIEWQKIAEYLGAEPANGWQKELWNQKKDLLEQKEMAYYEKAAKLTKKNGTDPLFRISHSSLGKTEITGCDFSGFQFQYYNSNLLGCFITGTKLPKEKIDIYNPVAPGTPVSDQEWYEQKTSIYNQFKKIYENQGDVVEASWYHAKAMANQQCLLKLLYHEEPKPRYKKMWDERSFELIGFRLNRFSNNHGESWRRAIRFVLLFSLIFYSVYYWSIHYKDGFVLSWDALDYFWGDYFSFLDITHRIDFHVDKGRLNFFSKLFDYSGKLVIGYGLYQLITAFRRHGKKGG